MTIDWVQVSALVGVIAMVLGIWTRVEGMVRRNADALAAYKLHVAESYTTKKDLGEMSDRIMGAIADVQAGITQTRERIDRAFDKPTRARSPG